MGIFATAALAAGGYVFLFSQKDPLKGKRPKDSGGAAIGDFDADGIVDDADGWYGDTALGLTSRGWVDIEHITPDQLFDTYNYYDLDTKQYGYIDPLNIQATSDAAVELYEDTRGAVKAAATIPKLWIISFIILLLYLRK